MSPWDPSSPPRPLFRPSRPSPRGSLLSLSSLRSPPPRSLASPFRSGSLPSPRPSPPHTGISPSVIGGPPRLGPCSSPLPAPPSRLPSSRVPRSRRSLPSRPRSLSLSLSPRSRRPPSRSLAPPPLFSRPEPRSRSAGFSFSDSSFRIALSSPLRSPFAGLRERLPRWRPDRSLRLPSRRLRLSERPSSCDPLSPCAPRPEIRSGLLSRRLGIASKRPALGVDGCETAGEVLAPEPVLLAPLWPPGRLARPRIDAPRSGLRSLRSLRSKEPPWLGDVFCVSTLWIPAKRLSSVLGPRSLDDAGPVGGLRVEGDGPGPA